MKNLTILKIGGNVIDNKVLLQSILEKFSGWSENRILIHGGGKIANELMLQLGIEPLMNGGRRITDKKTLEIVTSVYAGLINKNIVCNLQSKNCNAFGLTGADGNVIPATLRPVKEIDYGFVGDINPQDINIPIITSLLENNLIPVFAPITHDKCGQLLNTNADTIASSLAVALAGTYKVKLVFCLEKNGVLINPDDLTSVIPEITEKTFLKYVTDGKIHSGMIPKLENAFKALNSGVSEINICGPAAFDDENFVAGTKIVI